MENIFTKKRYNFTAPDGTKIQQWTEAKINATYKNKASSIILKAVIDEGLMKIAVLHDDLSQSLVGNPTRAESESWKYKLEAATAVLAGTATVADISVLEPEAIQSGQKIEERSEIVRDKSVPHREVIGLTGAYRLKYRDFIKAATDASQVEGYLTQAKAEAATILAARPGK